MGEGTQNLMLRRPLLTAIVATALYAVVLVGTASAELHQVRVTLITGQVLTLQVDVAPGTTVTVAQLPALPATVQSIQDLGPIQVPTPVPTPELPQVPVPTPTVPSVPGVPNPGGGGGGGGTPDNPVTGGGGGGGGGQDGQQPGVPSVPGVTGPAKGRAEDPGANTESVEGQVRERARKTRERAREVVKKTGRNLDGSPTVDNPTFSLALPGAAPIGVPNFFIDKFRIPPFLLPIYQAAGIEYGVRWEVLAAINEIETDYGRNLNVSSAGALGWMQFMPATWKTYGVDANRDGSKDPYNPVDAIFAAARYLQGRRRRDATCAARSSPTTTPTGTSTPCSCARASSAACRPTSSARSPA